MQGLTSFGKSRARSDAEKETVRTNGRGRKWEHHIEQYLARDDGITLHTWTEVEGSKTENFYITGLPGTPIPLWFRHVLRKKELSDIADFPSCSSCR